MIKLASLALALGIIFGKVFDCKTTFVFIVLRLVVWSLSGLNIWFLTEKKNFLSLFLFIGVGEFIFSFNQQIREDLFFRIKRARSLVGRLIKMDQNHDKSFTLIFKLETMGFFPPLVSCKSWNKNLCLNSDYKFGLYDHLKQSNFMTIRDWKLASGRLGWQRMIRFRPPSMGNRLLEISRQRLSKKAHTLYSAVFLGHKDLSDSLEIKEPFVRTGLIHFMARSGLHVLMITDLVGKLLKFLFVPWHLSWLLQLLFLILYSLFSWPSVSFSRAILMVVLSLLGNRIGKNVSFDHYFYLVLFCTLFTNPYQLFCLDFQLSFSLTMALLLAMN